MYSGIYAALLARGSVIGLVSIEHPEPGPLHRPRRRAAQRVRRAGRARPRQRPVVRAAADRRAPRRSAPASPATCTTASASRSPTSPSSSTGSSRPSHGASRSGDSLEQLRSDIRDVIRDVRDTLYDLRTDVSESQDMLDRPRPLSPAGAGADRPRHRPPRARRPAACRSSRSASCSASPRRRSPTSRSTPAPSTSRVTWQCDGTTAALEVTDDGKGFPIGRAGRLDSYGIIGMRERAASIGATLEVDSTPGRRHPGPLPARRLTAPTVQPPRSAPLRHLTGTRPPIGVPSRPSWSASHEHPVVGDDD